MSKEVLMELKQCYFFASGSLLPGALVNIKVGKILTDGLVVSFLTYFHGTIDLFHISKVIFATLFTQ